MSFNKKKKSILDFDNETFESKDVITNNPNNKPLATNITNETKDIKETNVNFENNLNNESTDNLDENVSLETNSNNLNNLTNVNKVQNVSNINNQNKLSKLSLLNNATNLSKFNKENLLNLETFESKKTVVSFEVHPEILEALDDISFSCNGYPKNLIVNEALADLLNKFLLTGKTILKKPDSLKRGKKREI